MLLQSDVIPAVLATFLVMHHFYNYAINVDRQSVSQVLEINSAHAGRTGVAEDILDQERQGRPSFIMIIF